MVEMAALAPGAEVVWVVVLRVLVDMAYGEHDFNVLPPIGHLRQADGRAGDVVVTILVFVVDDPLFFVLRIAEYQGVIRDAAAAAFVAGCDALAEGYFGPVGWVIIAVHRHGYKRLNVITQTQGLASQDSGPLMDCQRALNAV